MGNSCATHFNPDLDAPRQVGTKMETPDTHVFLEAMEQEHHETDKTVVSWWKSSASYDMQKLLKGSALLWWAKNKTRLTQGPWSMFKTALLQRFPWPRPANAAASGDAQAAGKAAQDEKSGKERSAFGVEDLMPLIRKAYEFEHRPRESFGQFCERLDGQKSGGSDTKDKPGREGGDPEKNAPPAYPGN